MARVRSARNCAKGISSLLLCALDHRALVAVCLHTWGSPIRQTFLCSMLMLCKSSSDVVIVLTPGVTIGLIAVGCGAEDTRRIRAAVVAGSRRLQAMCRSDDDGVTLRLPMSEPRVPRGCARTARGTRARRGASCAATQ